MKYIIEHYIFLSLILIFLIFYYVWFFYYYKKKEKHIKNIKISDSNIKNINIFASNDDDILVHSEIDAKLVDYSNSSKNDWKTALSELNTSSENLLHNNNLDVFLEDLGIDLKED